jgi:glutathione synthase/RimK-type ligase-like ATP-grasp enzyme
MKAAILNAGDGSWVFEEHAKRLSRALNLEIRASPSDSNYVLGWERAQEPSGASFIPLESVHLAADKRLLAQVFAAHQVATPKTYLLDSEAEVEQIVRTQTQNEWVLKWPVGCGGSGHRLQLINTPIPADWPRPFLLQEFVRLERPEVYRLYGVGGETFGWNARRFPSGAKTSPFVAHARGARYEEAGKVPVEAEKQARLALSATGLLASFGCVDLMCDAQNRWLVLEVGTDGVFNHVDRDIGIGGIAEEIERRLAAAFWKWLEDSHQDE